MNLKRGNGLCLTDKMLTKRLSMEIDKTTYDDLSIFNGEDDSSVFHKLDFTRTIGGRNCLMNIFNNPSAQPGRSPIHKKYFLSF